MEQELSGYTMKSLGANIRQTWSKWKNIILLQSLIHWLLFYSGLSTFEASGEMDVIATNLGMKFIFLFLAFLLIGFNSFLVILGLLLKIACQLFLKESAILFLSRIWSFKFPTLAINFLISSTLACLFALSSVSGDGIFYPSYIDNLSIYYAFVFFPLTFFLMLSETIIWLLFRMGRSLALKL